jgi:sigma-B regulation protein RsbQ
MVERRNNIRIFGEGASTLLFAHGFGCDQAMWEPVAEMLADTYRIALFDHVGAGRSDLSAYDEAKYETLEGYAEDVCEIARWIDAPDLVFVGHSVSAMIGALAAIREPGLFSKLVMVGPSPRYIDDGHYVGGFDEKQIDELLEFLENNHLGWSAAMGPAIMGNPDRPELGERLTNSFCNTDPDIARQFARATFFSDNRADLPNVPVPALVLQCSNDIIAPDAVGRYVADKIPDSTFVQLAATGHCPNLSAPEEVAQAIRQYVAA